MAYRIRPDKRFADEVKSTAQEQLDEAITVLTDQPEGPHEGIHDARKRIKRTRALYRLMGKAIPEFQERENQRLRDVAHSLSGIRDATALVEAGKKLVGSAVCAEESLALTRSLSVITARRDRIASEETHLDEKIGEAVRACREAQSALDDLPLDLSGKKAGRLLRKGWKKTLRKADKALDACRNGAGGAEFHALRKCTQDYWMHHLLMRDLWPAAMHAKELEAKELVDVLGYHQDLVVLTEVVNRERALFENDGDLSHLLEAIIRQQQHLREEALDRARWVFAGKSDHEERLIQRLWLNAR